MSCELVPIETIGDKKLDTSIAKIGSKGVFTQELEEMLENGEVDIAVHSAKDLSATLPGGFELIAFGPREEVADVLISNKEIELSQSLIIGSSSTRRVAQLARHYSRFSCTPVRGNLQTRMEKMKDGACDALMLAKAGVLRMGFQDRIVHEFPLEEITPAAGQGSVALEAHENLDSSLRDQIRTAVNDIEAEKVITCERAFLKTLEGGCSIPVFAHAHLEENDEINLFGGILSLDGNEIVNHQSSGNDPIDLGNEVAQEVLTKGGDAILMEITKSMQ